MTRGLADILTDALLLPEPERGELAARLIDSLDPATDDDAESAWAEEVRGRLEELRTGRVSPIPWPEARRLILEDGDGPDAG